MARQMFVDENKSTGLLLVGVCYAPGDVAVGRARLRELLLPGQERLHFSHERDGRRRRILHVATQEVSRVVVVQAETSLSPSRQRQLALSELANQAVRAGVSRMWIEQDDSVLTFDRKVMFEHSRMSGAPDSFSYGWLRPRQEPLLWAADGIAWAWARGGVWRDMVAERVEVTAVHVP